MTPDWSLPKGVCALVTTRFGGKSSAPYDTLNVGDHVGDSPQAVAQNRAILQAKVGASVRLNWLEQTHSTHCIELSGAQSLPIAQTDAAWTALEQQACVVMTADCLPILLCQRNGEHIAAIHAGWKGLVDGIIQQTLSQIAAPASEFRAWIGPSITQSCFEVGSEVIESINALDLSYQSLSALNENGRYQLDLAAVAEQELRKYGVTEIVQSGLCSYQDVRFYSYRQACHQGVPSGATGRMATLIWKTGG